MNKILSTSNNFFILFKLIWTYSKLELILCFFIYIIIGLIPSLMLLTSSIIIEDLTQGVYEGIFFLVVFYVGISSVQDAIQSITFFITNTLQDKINMGFQDEMNHMVSTYPNLKVIEKKELRDKVILSQKLIENIGELVPSVFSIFYGVVAIIPIIFLISKIHWSIPILVLSGLVPIIYTKSSTEIKSWSANENHSEDLNVIRIINRLLTQPNFAKDIRLFNMQPALRNKWNLIYSNFIKSLVSIRIKSSILLLLSSLLSFFLILLAFYITYNQFILNIIGISGIVIFMGSIMQTKDILATLTYNYSNVLRTLISFKPFKELGLERKREIDKIAHNYSNKILEDAYSFSFKDVNFKYEGSEFNAISNLSMAFKNGEVIMIVGENGSGKSTLVKLICGFYAPDSGEILWSYKEPRITGLLQDFSHFPLNTYENLCNTNDEDIKNILIKLNLEKTITDYSVPLSNEIKNGIDLSGGQWQKLAFARSILKSNQTDIFIFDEPTSFLDPFAEKQIIDIICNNPYNKTTILVTHLIKIGRKVDRILVMDQGKIIESGSFNELMDLKGKFYEMYTTQE